MIKINLIKSDTSKIDAERKYQRDWARARRARRTEDEKEIDRQKNKEYYAKSKRDYYQENPERWSNRELVKKYGITLAQKKAQFEYQKGLCACCYQPFESFRHACVDHCHISQKNRELLCIICNVQMGVIDNDARLYQLLLYRNKHRAVDPYWVSRTAIP